LFFDWSVIGAGFSCSVVNETGTNLSIGMGNFTNTVPTNATGCTKVQNNGVGAVWTYSPDGGITKTLRLLGQGVP
jgi:hypothetical protein